MQKGQTLIFLLVGILVLTVAGGAYYWNTHRETFDSKLARQNPMVSLSTNPPEQNNKPTPDTKPNTGNDETANWKMYTNSKFGFSIQYPQDATLRDTFDPRDNKPASYLVDFQLPRKTELDAIAMFTIEVLDNPQQLNAKDYFIKNHQASVEYAKINKIPPPPSVEKEGLVKIGNVDSYSVTLNPRNDALIIAVYTPKENKMFYIYFREDKANDPLAEEHTKVFNQILSTFKFTQSP